VIEALEAAWARSDALFDVLVGDDAWGARPIRLRHPFVFYLGHLPAFAWNQIGAGALGLGPHHAEFDDLFERGIDPDDESADEAGEGTWPAIDDVIGYRDEVRARLRAVAPSLRERAGDPLADGDRVLHAVVEHELMHHETLLYMLQRLGSERKRRPQWLPPPTFGAGGEEVPERIAIPAGEATVGAGWDEIAFGRDNEFPAQTTSVAGFAIDALPVTVARFGRFVSETGAEPPIDWEGDRLRTMWGSVPLDEAGSLPVCATQEQASAFAAWAGGRLPTEAELHRAAVGATAVGIGWTTSGPAPVGTLPGGVSDYGVRELVGNGWEQTATPFGPLPGFEAWMRTYPGYSADFFDGRHFVVFGASWATSERLTRRSWRNWYYRHYPHAFTKFRVVW